MAGFFSGLTGIELKSRSEINDKALGKAGIGNLQGWLPCLNDSWPFFLDEGLPKHHARLTDGRD